MSTTTVDPRTATAPPLEAEAQAFADANANPPFLYDLGPEKGREAVNQTQAGEIAKPDIIDEWIEVPGGPAGDVPVRIVRPAGATGTLPVILYIHGAGRAVRSRQAQRPPRACWPSRSVGARHDPAVGQGCSEDCGVLRMPAGPAVPMST